MLPLKVLDYISKSPQKIIKKMIVGFAKVPIIRAKIKS